MPAPSSLWPSPHDSTAPGTAIALLRAVNVSGQRRVLMTDLRRSLEELGGRTKLNNASFEKACGVAATTRSWRTVLALTELSS